MTRALAWCVMIAAMGLTACCGAAATPEPSGATATAPSSGAAAEYPAAAGTEAGAAGTTAQPPSPQPSTAGAGAMPAGGTAPQTMSSEQGLQQWEGRLDQAQRSLSAAGSECREVCRASGDICVAAREICSLTGDGDAAAPSDGRCGRARNACEQATRQRDSACPVCPSTR